MVSSTSKKSEMSLTQRSTSIPAPPAKNRFDHPGSSTVMGLMSQSANARISLGPSIMLHRPTRGSSFVDEHPIEGTESRGQILNIKAPISACSSSLRRNNRGMITQCPETLVVGRARRTAMAKYEKAMSSKPRSGRPYVEKESYLKILRTRHQANA